MPVTGGAGRDPEAEPLGAGFGVRPGRHLSHTPGSRAGGTLPGARLLTPQWGRGRPRHARGFSGARRACC